MANGHGGQRTPAHPAPVSGPGALSARTDGGPTSQPPMLAPGGPYGSRQDMAQIQQGAALQGGGGAPAAPQAPPSPNDAIPFDAPSQNPTEPVTAGAALGPGIGPQAAGIQSDAAASIAQMTPLIGSLEMMANLPNSTPEFRTFVRNLKAQAIAQGGPSAV